MGLSNWLMLTMYPGCQEVALDMMIRQLGKFAKQVG